MELATLRAELNTDRCCVDRYLSHLLGADATKANGMVQEAMRYAVLGPAQRIRPILALRVARMLRAPQDLTIRAAAAVELLHCASLIVDDLPCMDDSPFRRERPSAHVMFGEANAVLAAFGLVALSARTLVEFEAADSLYRQEDRERLVSFQAQLLRSLDCAGLIAGQALDLHLAGQRHLRTCPTVTEMKTVPLFVLAVSAGSLFANVDANGRALLDCFGREFGLAFQMVDDLVDGEEIEVAALQEKLSMMCAALGPFGSRKQDLEDLVSYLDARVEPLCRPQR